MPGLISELVSELNDPTHEQDRVIMASMAHLNLVMIHRHRQLRARRSSSGGSCPDAGRPALLRAEDLARDRRRPCPVLHGARRCADGCDPGSAKAITAREWQLIAKDPGSHSGERVIVYGEVTQFDSATGTTGFRANVDGAMHKVKYGYAGYETNTVLSAGSGVSLSDVLEDDLFKAEVTVVGACNYDTAIDGSSTAPMLLVTKIEVTGSTK